MKNKAICHVAIVGLGSIGRRHLRILKKTRPDLIITVVRSGNGQSCDEEGLADYVVSDIKDTFSNGVELAFITSPAVCHINQAIEFASKGVHLFIEKPLSVNLKLVDKLVSIANKRNIIVSVGYVLRFDEAARQYKDLIDSSSVGKLVHIQINAHSYLPNWRPGQDYRESASAKSELGGGVLLELSHEIDYTRWFFGDIQYVTSYLSNSHTLNIDVEDSADLIMICNKIPINMHLDFNQHNNIRQCVASGTAGTVIWDLITNTVILKRIGTDEQKWHYSSSRDENFKKEIDHVIHCVEHHRKPFISLSNSIEVMKIVDAARLSSEKNMRVKIL